MSSLPTSTSDIQSALKSSSVLLLRNQIENLDGALGTFERFFNELEKSLDQSVDQFKKMLMHSEKEFGDMQKAEEALTREIKEWKENLSLYAQLWK
jgi:hypothetical protein